MRLTILSFFLVILTSCCFSQTYHNNDYLFLKTLTKADLGILCGDVGAYWKLSNQYYELDEPDSLYGDFVFYSYIMATVHNYRPAAYDCFTLLGGLDDAPKDSALTQLLLHLLEIGASGDTSCAEVSEIGSAFLLSKWYMGRQYVNPVPQKSEYYGEKAHAMARCRKRKMTTD